MHAHAICMRVTYMCVCMHVYVGILRLSCGSPGGGYSCETCDGGAAGLCKAAGFPNYRAISPTTNSFLEEAKYVVHY